LSNSDKEARECDLLVRPQRAPSRQRSILDLAASIEWCNKAAVGLPQVFYPLIDLAAANAWAGQDKEAKEAAAQFLTRMRSAISASSSFFRQLGPCWAAIDLVGSPSTAALAFDSLGRGGKLIMVGLFGGEATWPLPLILMKAATISGSYQET
jgi:D-arabinose 1-dehydrogenase-like Zn-dependent alcohol dehydrogenase